jgi:hypothetical protein
MGILIGRKLLVHMYPWIRGFAECAVAGWRGGGVVM